MGWKWGYVVAGRKEKEFKADLSWLFKVIKLKYGVSQDQVIVDFCEHMEHAEGEAISPEAIYAYLQGRANFPFTVGVSFLNFLADGNNGKRRRYPEALEFIKKWYLPMVPYLKKFLHAAQERQAELEEEKKRYDFSF